MNTAEPCIELGGEAAAGGVGQPVSRRRFLGTLLKGTAAVCVGTAAYSVAEGRYCTFPKIDLPVPHLPEAFEGLTAAFLTDLHHSPWVPISYIDEVIAAVNNLRPHFVFLGGDYITKERDFAPSCIAALGRLNPRDAICAVLGNHDHVDRSAPVIREAMRKHHIAELTNRGIWVHRGSARMRICGVGDLWRDHQDLRASLDDARDTDATILLSHNPDYTERIRDPRVGLVLSGHTHGGQCQFPGIGAPILPSRYGQKYRDGFCQGPVTRAFVSRGVGMSGVPFRFNCPPEIPILTLRRAGVKPAEPT